MINCAFNRPLGWLKAAPIALCALALFAGTARAQDRVVEETVGSPWTTSIGGGMHFFEADEDRYPGQVYELRQGYDFTPNLTLEASAGYAPFVAEQDVPIPDEDAVGVRLGADLLYHFNEYADRIREGQWDPYVGINGGALWLSERRRDTNDMWTALYGGTAGVGYALDDAWQVRGDYRLMAAGTDAQLNHSAMLLLTYRWGAEERQTSRTDTTNTIFDDSNQTRLQPVFFAYDSAKLSDTAKQKLRENAAVLNEDTNKAKKVVVEGHCDERGTNEYNMALGQRRANSAFEFLRSLGIPQERMSTVSFGEEKPADPGHNEAAWSKNRRAETVLINR